MNGLYIIKIHYTNKENAADILDDLCAGFVEDEFRDSWIGWRNMNTIITNWIFGNNYSEKII